MVIEIDERLPTWNKFYAGVHFAERVALKNMWKAIVLAVLPADVEMFDKPVRIEVHAEYKGPTPDVDNVCPKMVIDALKGRVLRDDDPTCVTSILVTSRRSKRNHTTVVIEEV